MKRPRRHPKRRVSRWLALPVTLSLLAFPPAHAARAGGALTPARAGASSLSGEPTDPGFRWLALGDSYSSGEGLEGAYLPQTAALLRHPEFLTKEQLHRFVSPKTMEGIAQCQRVTGNRWTPDGDEPSDAGQAWPARAFAMSQRAQQTQDPELDFSACSRALADDAYEQIFEGATGKFYKTNPVPLTYDSWQPLQQKWNVVSMSFGGNNIGFSDLITKCIDADVLGVLARQVGGRRGCRTTWPEMKARIDRLTGKTLSAVPGFEGFSTLPDIYDKAADVTKPGGVVIVAGYPQLVADPASWPKNESMCASGILASEAGFLRKSADYLDDQIRDTVSAAQQRHAPEGVSFKFVDLRPIYDAPGGDPASQHSLCGGGENWLHGLTAPIHQSFHPLQPGEDATALAVARAVDATVAEPPVLTGTWRSSSTGAEYSFSPSNRHLPGQQTIWDAVLGQSHLTALDKVAAATPGRWYDHEYLINDVSGRLGCIWPGGPTGLAIADGTSTFTTVRIARDPPAAGICADPWTPLNGNQNVQTDPCLRGRLSVTGQSITTESPPCAEPSGGEWVRAGLTVPRPGEGFSEAQWLPHVHRLNCDGRPQRVLPIQYADVTNDGVPEAFVASTCQPVTTDWPEQLEVFSGYGPAVKEIGTLVAFSSGRFGLSIAVAADRVTVLAAGFSPATARCCPDLLYSSTFRWAGSAFKKISERGDSGAYSGASLLSPKDASVSHRSYIEITSVDPVAHTIQAKDVDVLLGSEAAAECDRNVARYGASARDGCEDVYVKEHTGHGRKGALGHEPPLPVAIHARILIPGEDASEGVKPLFGTLTDLAAAPYPAAVIETQAGVITALESIYRP